MYEAMAADHRERYNRLHPIEHQQNAIEQLDFPDVLSAVAQILHRHGAHVDFGIILLHRHHDLAPNCVMVHSRDLPGEDICKMERLGERRLFPHAYQYHSDCDEFVPYEYSTDPTPTPKEPLLTEVAALLRSRDICHLIGIFHAKSPGRPWREKTLRHNEEGTIATQLSMGQRLSHDDIVTEWVIRKGVLGVELEAYKTCTDTDAGHKRD